MRNPGRKEARRLNFILLISFLPGLLRNPPESPSRDDSFERLFKPR
jgi:hypothetical protein